MEKLIKSYRRGKDSIAEIELGGDKEMSAKLLKLIIESFQAGFQSAADASALGRMYELGHYIAKEHLEEGKELADANCCDFIEAIEEEIDRILEEKEDTDEKNKK